MACNSNLTRVAAAAGRSAGISRLVSQHTYWNGVHSEAVRLPAMATSHRRQRFLHLWREVYGRCRLAAEVSSLTELLDLYFWGRRPRRKKLSGGEYLTVMGVALTITLLVSVAWLVQEKRGTRAGEAGGKLLPSPQ